MLGTTDNGQKVVLNQDGTWHYQNAGLAKADNRHCFEKPTGECMQQTSNSLRQAWNGSREMGS